MLDDIKAGDSSLMIPCRALAAARRQSPVK
jgi:hypothetical protein